MGCLSLMIVTQLPTLSLHIYAKIPKQKNQTGPASLSQMSSSGPIIHGWRFTVNDRNMAVGGPLSLSETGSSKIMITISL